MFKFLASFFSDKKEENSSDSHRSSFRDDRIISRRPQPRNIGTRKTESNVEPSSSKNNDPRELLKQATSLKKEKQYKEACERLKQAYNIADAMGIDLGAKEHLRLAMYYQLAGKNDKGWRVLNEVNLKYTDVYSQAEIANQIRVFLTKEGNYKLSIVYMLWARCKLIERDIYSLESSQSMIAEFKRDNTFERSAFKQFEKRIDLAMDTIDIVHSISKQLKQAGKQELAQSIAADAANYLSKKEAFHLRDVHQLVENHWSN